MKGLVLQQCSFLLWVLLEGMVMEPQFTEGSTTAEGQGPFSESEVSPDLDLNHSNLIPLRLHPHESCPSPHTSPLAVSFLEPCGNLQNQPPPSAGVSTLRAEESVCHCPALCSSAVPFNDSSSLGPFCSRWLHTQVLSQGFREGQVTTETFS